MHANASAAGATAHDPVLTAIFRTHAGHEAAHAPATSRLPQMVGIIMHRRGEEGVAVALMNSSSNASHVVRCLILNALIGCQNNPPTPMSM